MAALIAPRMFVTPLTVPAGGVGRITPVLDDVNLKTVRIVIPDGHAGLTALHILQGGVPIFPFGTDPFLRGNDEIIDYEWDSEITANGMAVEGFNGDVWPHTWIIRWILTDLTPATPVVIASPQAGAAPDPATIAAVADLAGVTP